MNKIGGLLQNRFLVGQVIMMSLTQVRQYKSENKTGESSDKMLCR
jgi:hypothetical protein